MELIGRRGGGGGGCGGGVFGGGFLFLFWLVLRRGLASRLPEFC